jgi:hypothetical protein
MYPVPEQGECGEPGCLDLQNPLDPTCADMNKCCVGVHDFGPHQMCTKAVRNCRKLGNAWDAPRPLQPLPGEYLYTEKPGYTTTGQLLEGFGNLGGLSIDCLVRNLIYTGLITAFLFYLTGRPMNYQEIALIAGVASVLKCLLM